MEEQETVSQQHRQDDRRRVWRAWVSTSGSTRRSIRLIFALLVVFGVGSGILLVHHPGDRHAARAAG